MPFISVRLDPNDFELLQIKRQEANLLRRRQQLIKENGILHYSPHPKQDAFHRAGEFKRRGVFAGNRFGKSDCGAAEDVAQAMGERIWYPKTDPARYAGIPQRPQKILIITNDWGKVDEIFTSERGEMGKLWRFFPRGFIKSKKRNHSGAIETMECINGSLIQFDTVESFKKNPQSAESSDWDVIHGDEPCPEAMYNAHARGLMDRNGKSYFTLTALKERWIPDLFFGDESADTIVRRGSANVFNKNFWSITGSIWDNPYLSEEAITLFLDSLNDPEERECRETGIPLQFAGLIYKEFNRQLHLLQSVPKGWADAYTPPLDWPVYIQIDPHPQTPVATLLCTVDPTGRKYLFDEIWRNGIVREICEDILEKVDCRLIVRAKADPCAFNEDRLTGTCWADDFALHGLPIDRAIKDLARGIKATKAALRSRMSDGMPEWMVSPACKRFLWEIARWAWDKDDKPVDKNDHLMECFYRMVLEAPTYVSREDDRFENNDLEMTGLSDDDRQVTRSKYDI